MRDKRSGQGEGKGAAGSSLLAQGLSLGKCRDTLRFWLRGEGLGSALSFLSLSELEETVLLLLWGEFAATVEFRPLLLLPYCG